VSRFFVLIIVLVPIRDVWGMLILTLPFVLSVILRLLDPVWSAFFTREVEIALIIPPIGSNVYVDAQHRARRQTGHIFKGRMPFAVR